MEIWKEIAGLEGFYEVSNKGNVRSLDRIVDHQQGPMRRRGQVMKQRIVKGYFMVCLRKNGEAIYESIHRLVASAFCGGAGDQVRHLDGNPLNNVDSNLLWGTAAENARDREDHGRTSRGLSSPRRRVSEINMQKIKKLSLAGISGAEIGRALGMNKSRVYEIAKNNNWLRAERPTKRMHSSFYDGQREIISAHSVRIG